MFGRIKNSADDRDWNGEKFLGAEKVMAAVNVRSQVWQIDHVLNQEKTNHCVGFSMAQFCVCLPMNTPYTEKDAHEIYYKAVEIEGDPSSEIGTTIRNGAKSLRARGRIQHYALFNAQSDMNSIINWVLTTGPIVVGTNWYDSMNNPNADGLVTSISGDIVGGHAYLLNGVDRDLGVFYFTNSWGEDWGLKGKFSMFIKDFEKVFREDGDAMVAVEVMPETIVSE